MRHPQEFEVGCGVWLPVSHLLDNLGGWQLVFLSWSFWAPEGGSVQGTWPPWRHWACSVVPWASL